MARPVSCWRASRHFTWRCSIGIVTGGLLGDWTRRRTFQRDKRPTRRSPGGHWSGPSRPVTWGLVVQAPKGYGGSTVMVIPSAITEMVILYIPFPSPPGGPTPGVLYGRLAVRRDDHLVCGHLPLVVRKPREQVARRALDSGVRSASAPSATSASRSTSIPTWRWRRCCLSISTTNRGPSEKPRKRELRRQLPLVPCEAQGEPPAPCSHACHRGRGAM